MRRYLIYVSLIAIFSILAGCATIPDLGKIPKTKTATDYESNETFASVAVSGTWPETNWWEMYGDAQLSRLIEKALQNAPSIAQAEARIRQAEGIAEQAGANLYPSISANGSYERLRQSYNQGFPEGSIPTGFRDVASISFNLNFQVDFWGKNRASLAAAISDVKAAELENEQARLIISTSVAGAYADLAQLYITLGSAKDALHIRSQSAALIKQRLDNGLENRGSYEQQVALLAATEAHIESLNEAILLARNRLIALVGIGPDQALSMEKPNIKHLRPFGLPENLCADLLGRRPDIMAARMRAEAFRQRIHVAKARFYPNINLIGFIGHRSLGLEYFTSDDSLIAGIGPAVSLPILDGGALKGQYRQARAAYDGAVAAYNATLLHSLHDVANVVVSEKMLVPRMEKVDRTVQASEKAYEIIKNRYKEGLSQYLAVLRSEDSLIESRHVQAELRTRAFKLDVALVRSLGGGFVSHQKLE